MKPVYQVLVFVLFLVLLFRSAAGALLVPLVKYEDVEIRRMYGKFKVLHQRAFGSAAEEEQWFRQFAGHVAAVNFSESASGSLSPEVFERLVLNNPVADIPHEAYSDPTRAKYSLVAKDTVTYTHCACECASECRRAACQSSVIQLDACVGKTLARVLFFPQNATNMLVLRNFNGESCTNGLNNTQEVEVNVCFSEDSGFESYIYRYAS